MTAGGCGRGPDDGASAKTYLTPAFADCRFGYLDTLGRWAVPPRFHAARPFSEGLAAVREEGLYGYLDAAGNYAIAPQFAAAGDFSDGFAVVYEATRGTPLVVDRAGRRAFPYDSARTRVEVIGGQVAVYASGTRYGEDLVQTLVERDGRATRVSPDLEVQYVPALGLLRVDPRRPSTAGAQRPFYLTPALERLAVLDGAVSVRARDDGYLACWQRDHRREFDPADSCVVLDAGFGVLARLRGSDSLTYVHHPTTGHGVVFAAWGPRQEWLQPEARPYALVGPEGPVARTRRAYREIVVTGPEDALGYLDDSTAVTLSTADATERSPPRMVLPPRRVRQCGRGRAGAFVQGGQFVYLDEDCVFREVDPAVTALGPVSYAHPRGNLWLLELSDTSRAVARLPWRRRPPSRQALWSERCGVVEVGRQLAFGDRLAYGPWRGVRPDGYRPEGLIPVSDDSVTRYVAASGDVVRRLHHADADCRWHRDRVPMPVFRVTDTPYAPAAGEPDGHRALVDLGLDDLLGLALVHLPDSSDERSLAFALCNGSDEWLHPYALGDVLGADARVDTGGGAWLRPRYAGSGGGGRCGNGLRGNRLPPGRAWLLRMPRPGGALPARLRLGVRYRVCPSRSNDGCSGSGFVLGGVAHGTDTLFSDPIPIGINAAALLTGLR